MRLVRLGALFGSLVLLVATMVSLFDTRSELRSDQAAHADAAAIMGVEAVSSTVVRMTALVNAANDATDPSELLASFGAGAEVCVGAGDDGCSTSELQATDSFGTAVELSVRDGGRAVAAVDRPSQAIVVVARDATGTVGLSVPLDEVVSAEVRKIVRESDVGLVVMAAIDDGTDGGLVAETSDGERVVTAVLSEPPIDIGAVAVVTTVDVTVGIGADAPLLYGTLLALGTVLLALAGWTFLVERRSLERRATTDELTGLANRREFETESIEQLLVADRTGAGVCVMLLDLNGFKQINDTLGHHVGDLVLQGCGERLRSAVRESDLVGRWGGDEFVVLLPGIEDGTAVRIAAERIAHALSTMPIVDDITVTASIGAALYPRHGRNLDELVRNADLAMYGAKTSGVIHRMADPLATAPPEVLAGTYVGNDRRRSPLD